MRILFFAPNSRAPQSLSHQESMSKKNCTFGIKFATKYYRRRKISNKGEMDNETIG